MRNISKFIFSLMLSGGVAVAAPAGKTLFTITPSETNFNVSSNGNSSMIYTVTNNSSASVTPSITVGYQSSGNNFTIGSNTCNSPLASQASCTFRVLISGSNQPANFTITPRVCGFNGFMCSVTSTPVTVTVDQLAAGLVTRAYETVINNDVPSTTLLGININNTSDVISFLFSEYFNNVNSVVISPDGSKVYAIQVDGSSVSVLFFNVTNDALILKQIVPLPGVDLDRATTVASNLQMALTPDGSTLFITRYTPVGLRSKAMIPAPSLYRIDLTTDASTAIPIADPDNILSSSSGLIVSPDSKTLYVGTNTNYLIAMPVTANSVNSTNKVAVGSLIEDNHIGLAIDPAGNKLYVGNQADGSVSILAVNGMQASFEGTILSGSGFSGASGLAVSPDGATLYVAEKDNDKVLALSLSASGAVIFQSDVVGAFGLALSPNGSELYVTQDADPAPNITTVLNTTNFLATSIPIDGGSLTIGKFIGS